MGQRVRAARKEEEIPLNPFTAGVYIATMMATVQVLREKVRVSMLDTHVAWLLLADALSALILCGSRASAFRSQLDSCE